VKNRLEHIREQVKNEKKVTVSELSKIYKVTEETIRRDLEKLEKEGFLTRTFGGAVLNSASQKEHIHFYKRTSINQKEKAKIAQLFKEVLDQKRTIAADASTTVMEAIRLLKANRNITVLSSSTEIFREMTGSEIHILSTGGVFNEDSLSLQGNLAKENIRRYHVDLALLSCKGLDMDKGIMDSSEREADVKTEMVKQALEVALLADHTKFERTAFVQFLDWDKVTYLVTDERPSDQWVEFCKEKEITLIY
jgi:DeoR/GlpR family transcriptional regulator of sugar metabolism